MSNLTAAGRAAIGDLSRRYGLSEAAVEHMAHAVANGGGSMAQFNVPELGGSGQWMAGGMTMVGDMFNHGLQATVSNLCGELSSAMAGAAFFERPQASGMGGGFSGGWWPDWLGQPASTGGQNQARYAYFPHARRLAFDFGDGRPVALLDTGEHHIGGFSQQQSGPGDPFLGVSVSSQFGQFALSSFPFADGTGPMRQAQPAPQPEPQWAPEPQPFAQPAQGGAEGGRASADDILETIGRLAKLRDAGALSDEEFAAKKAELLARI
ncbi:SHOCT domain-containing protein [Albimonas pacifica]|uniref:Short C-terminal domain-containing protein n=1 Tax=Albimonas pacifica TaxID=1114924 RepID=A0A1I3FMF9_9RHOB|nr:SHOCT domain-containing protein [Albimonas pacifica]SFI12403.1 Short C-terminal domain-containing protein [Albimonas pacifica]